LGTALRIIFAELFAPPAHSVYHQGYEQAPITLGQIGELKVVDLSHSFLLDIDSLDKDHRVLADIVDQIVTVIDSETPSDCTDLVTKFVKSAKEHFAKEEALLVKVGYPNVKKHQDHHEGLYDKMDHMIVFAKMLGENQMARDSLRKELVFFLMDDVITTDMDFKNFVEENTKA
jgi:hemerythrin